MAVPLGLVPCAVRALMPPFVRVLPPRLSLAGPLASSSRPGLPHLRRVPPFGGSRCLHASRPARIPQLVALGARLAALVAARQTRALYDKMDKAAKRQWRHMLARSMAALGVLAGGLYAYNLQDTPVTHRRRLLYTSLRTERALGREQAELLMRIHMGRLVHRGPQYEQVRRVTRRLVGRGIARGFSHGTFGPGVVDGMDWSIVLVDAPMANAFVLPHGAIFVYTGLLDRVVSTDDELAIILGHEMSHALLRHGGERLSHQNVFLAAQVVASFVLWFFAPFVPEPRFVALIEGVQEMLLSVVISLPNSRAQETEADIIGLRLAAASCYDPAAAPVLWKRFARLKGEDERVSDWLSTHPNSEGRAVLLEKHLQEARRIARDSGCEAQLSDFRKRMRLSGV